MTISSMKTARLTQPRQHVCQPVLDPHLRPENADTHVLPLDRRCALLLLAGLGRSICWKVCVLAKGFLGASPPLAVLGPDAS